MDMGGPDPESYYLRYLGAGHILHLKWTCGSPAISPLNPICFVPSMASMHAKG